MATAISANWAELLEPGLRRIFFDAVDAIVATSRIPMLYNVTGSSKAQEFDLGVGGFGDFEEYAGTIEYDDDEQLFKTTYTHQEYAKGMVVERKLVDDDLYNVINQRPRKMGLAAARTREKHAASLLVNAFSSSFTGGVGKALCATDHPQSPTDSTSLSNKGTTALSYDSVVATRKLMRAFVDSRGELVTVQPNLILIPAELEDTAYDIVMTMGGRPGTANNSNNFVRDVGINYFVWDYLTDSNDWFMIDTGLAGLYLNWFDRVSLEFAVDPTSDFNLSARYRGYMRYSYGWSDWRWVYGHEVA
jgi:phage major head subunit gpT-like protein